MADPSFSGLELLTVQVRELQARVERLEGELARRLPRNFRVEHDPATGTFNFGNDAAGTSAPSGV